MNESEEASEPDRLRLKKIEQEGGTRMSGSSEGKGQNKRSRSCERDVPSSEASNPGENVSKSCDALEKKYEEYLGTKLAMVMKKFEQFKEFAAENCGLYIYECSEPMCGAVMITQVKGHTAPFEPLFILPLFCPPFKPLFILHLFCPF